MRLIFLLTLIGIFAQTSFLPLNLALIIILTRTLVVDEPSNYYLAFFAGILLGVQSLTNLGFYPLVFVILVKAINLFKKSPFSNNLLLIIPVSFLVFILMSFLEKIFLTTEINFQKIALEMFLSIPIYLFIRFWEERFVVKPNIKLRIKS